MYIVDIQRYIYDLSLDMGTYKDIVTQIYSYIDIKMHRCIDVRHVDM